MEERASFEEFLQNCKKHGRFPIVLSYSYYDEISEDALFYMGYPWEGEDPTSPRRNEFVACRERENPRFIEAVYTLGDLVNGYEDGHRSNFQIVLISNEYKGLYRVRTNQEYGNEYIIYKDDGNMKKRANEIYRDDRLDTSEKLESIMRILNLPQYDS